MASLTFRPDGLRPDDFQRSDILPPFPVSTTSEKRQAEYLAGRLCARQCLLARTGRAETPARGDDGAPIWPAGCIGSITHTKGWAAAVAGEKQYFDAVGLDAETLVSDARAAALAAKILSSDERQRFRAELADSPGLLVTLVFSMKESLFKALYPLVGRRFYFQDAELIAHSPDGSARLRLVTDLSANWPAGQKLDAQFALEEHRLISLVAVMAGQQH